MNIYDIAEKAGVSIATVSRVLNNPAAVSAKTREKVLLVIDEANFTPKLGTAGGGGSSAPAPLRTKDIGFFTTERALPLESHILAGVAEAAFADRMGVKLCSLDGLPKKPGEAAGHMAELGIGAALFTSIPQSPEYYREIAAAMPSLLLFNRLDLPDVDFIRADHKKGGYLAIQHLVHMNHRRFGIVDEFRSADHKDRLAGAMEAIEAFGLREGNEDPVIRVADMNETDMCSQVDHFLLRYPDTTALFVANDHFVPILYRHFRARGIRIPEDISIIGADDVPGSADLHPPLTTIRQPVKQMSLRAAQILVDRLHGTIPPEAAVQETFDVQLVVRASTRRLTE